MYIESDFLSTQICITCFFFNYCRERGFGTNFQNLMGPSEGIVLVWVGTRSRETWADELSYKPALP